LKEGLAMAAKTGRWNIFVTRQLPGEALKRLAKLARVEVWDRELPPPRAHLLKHLKTADAVVTMLSDRIDAAAIAAAPDLKVISNYAVGVDNVDLEAATRAGIAVGHTPGVLTEATADLAFGLLMTTARRIAEGDREVRAGKWRTFGPEVLLGADVHGATLGIIGWGAIGQATARRGIGFGMKILHLRPRGKSRRDHHEAAAPHAIAVTLARLLKESDFVSLHVPLTPQTRHLIGARELAHMKPGAILINTARGAIVDQKALTKALNSGHLAGAGLDVTDPEPIEKSDPLLKLPNVVIAPHIGSASRTTRERMSNMAVSNIITVMRGHLPQWCANPAVKLRHLY
jgi:glyoxylate reductase